MTQLNLLATIQSDALSVINFLKSRFNRIVPERARWNLCVSELIASQKLDPLLAVGFQSYRLFLTSRGLRFGTVNTDG
jgi:hypothetical protein